MKIVICDDNKIFKDELASKLISLLKKEHVSTEIISYDNPLELIQNADSGVDAYFLDIEMPEMDGIELARFLKKQRCSEFIFVSAHKELWQKTLKVKPIAFIRKDFLDVDIPSALENLTNELKCKDILVPLNNGKRKELIHINDVIYIKSENNYAILYYFDHHQQSIREKLDVIENQLCSYHFLRIHNRYLINMKRIGIIYGSNGKSEPNVIMEDNTALPISRAYLNSVRDILWQRNFK